MSTETVKFGQDLEFNATFDTLQQAQLPADPVETARNATWVKGGVSND